MLLHIFCLVSLNFVWVTSKNLAGVNYQDQSIQEIIPRHVEDVKHSLRGSQSAAGKAKDLANAGYDAASAGVKKGTEAIQNSGNQGGQQQQQSNDLANAGSDGVGSIISNFGDLAKSGIDSLGDHLGFDLEGQSLGGLGDLVGTTIDLGARSAKKAGDLANAGYEAAIAGINRGTQAINNLTHALPVVILD